MKIGLRDIRHLAIIGGAGAAGIVATLVVFEAVDRPHPDVVTLRAQSAPIVHFRSNVHVLKPARERVEEEAGVRLRRFEVRAAENMRPIVYLDGVRTESLGDLTPEAIAGIDVVKGDRAKERFGTEGAENGVILVTTKEGKKKARKGTEKER